MAEISIILSSLGNVYLLSQTFHRMALLNGCHVIHTGHQEEKLLLLSIRKYNKSFGIMELSIRWGLVLFNAFLPYGQCRNENIKWKFGRTFSSLKFLIMCTSAFKCYCCIFSQYWFSKISSTLSEIFPSSQIFRNTQPTIENEVETVFFFDSSESCCFVLRASEVGFT